MLSPVHLTTILHCFTLPLLQGSWKTPKLARIQQQPKPEQHKLCKPTSDLGSSVHIRSLMPRPRCSWLNWVWLRCAYLFSNPSSSCSADITSALPVRPAFTSPCYSFPPPSLLICPHATCLSSPACPGISSSSYLKEIPLARSPTGSDLIYPQPDEGGVCMYLCNRYACINTHTVRWTCIHFLLFP